MRSLAIFYLILFSTFSDYVVIATNSRMVWGDFLFYIFLGILCFSSGYLLSDRYHFYNLRQVFSFYYRRLARLYPFYWITLTIFLILDMIPFQTYLNNLLATNSIYFESLEILWFLSLILNFYLLFPFFTYHYHPWRALIILGLFYIIAWSIFEDLNIDFDNKLILFLPLFFLGIIVARHHVFNIFINQGLLPLAALFSIIVLANYHDQIALKDSVFEKIVPMMIAILGIPILYAIARILRVIFQKTQKTLGCPEIIRKAFNFMGYSSFSVYLLHRIVFNTGLEIYQPANDIKTLLYLGGGLLPITFLLAYGYQRSIDYMISKL